MHSTSTHAEAIERVERDAWLDLFAAAPPGAVEELGLAFARVDGIALLASRAVPITEFNRAMAVGVEMPAGTRDLEEAAAWLDAHAGKDWAFQSGPVGESDATRAWFDAHGLAPAGNGWAKFQLPAASFAGPPSAAGSIGTRQAEATDAATFGGIVRAVFGLPPSAAEWFAALVGRPNWTAYLACDGDVPVGAGAMFRQDGAAWLGIGATLSEFRSRGAQTALLARRIADACRSRIEVLTTETGYPAADATAFPSYRNVRRAGFDLAYVRPNYRRS